MFSTALSLQPNEIIDMDRSWLRGRGRRFPTGKWLKWQSSDPVRTVANATRGSGIHGQDSSEAISYVLDGLILACYAVGAVQAYFYTS